MKKKVLQVVEGVMLKRVRKLFYWRKSAIPDIQFLSSKHAVYTKAIKGSMIYKKIRITVEEIDK